MPFVMIWDGWDWLNIHGRTWMQKRTGDGLILLKLVSKNALGISHELSCAADTRECDMYAYMVECNKYYD